jgi:hypothetical protein
VKQEDVNGGIMTGLVELSEEQELALTRRRQMGYEPSRVRVSKGGYVIVDLYRKQDGATRQLFWYHDKWRPIK